MNDTILVTGGAGFIGANFILNWSAVQKGLILNLDKLTYAGNPENLNSLQDSKRYKFIKGDISDEKLVREILETYQPKAIINFAAETHVDRSIHDPKEFIETNVVGTYVLLEQSLNYWKTLKNEDKQRFRFLHVSTDEVYGSLTPTDPPFTETTQYAPNSPYAASKASSDHFVRSYFKTYGLPTITTHCTNNYGPYQFPEKLIPLMILNAMQGKKLPIYGDGQNERNWIHVKDHCSALNLLVEKGTAGSVYNIGHNHSVSNKEIVLMICKIMDEQYPESPSVPHSSLIEFVTDRPGHDWRYDIDSSKLFNDLGWVPSIDLAEGIKTTVKWYIENPDWIKSVITGEYQKWLSKNYQLN